MADDNTASPRPAFDMTTDQGRSAYVTDLHARHGVPEQLRYPDTDEEYDRMIDQAEASGYVPAEEVDAWIRSLGTANPLPRPRAK